ncbi:MAG TPA: secretin N-terminal domain-containing protein [Burkholderiales bacterium]
MKRIRLAILLALVSSCAERPVITQEVEPSILSEVQSAANQARSRQPDAVREALLPPLRAEIPKVPGAPVEPRFDLVVNAAPAQQVFMSIVSGTRYSMLLSPAVGGTISVNLKDVTVPEALDSIREVYGYEYKIDGARIHVQPAGLQTRVYHVSYMIGLRSGRSDVRVSSGVISGNIQQGGGGAPAGGMVGGFAATPGGQANSAALSAVGLGAIASTSLDASRVSTVSQSDLWNEVTLALRALIGTGEGRNVVVSPQSGVVVVRAMPEELRSVEAYLKAMRLSIGRQVMIEAKIVDVTLNGSYQAGINWAAFHTGPNSAISGGPLSTGTVLSTSATPGNVTGATSITGPAGSITAASPVFGAVAGQNLVNFTNPGASLLGLAFQTSNFSALLTFLETQGSTQVLSSPRIATLNNQKAVLKVGTDQFFLTSITSSTVSVSSTQTGVSLTPTFSPFFSGVSLDITPQIDEEGNIVLHIHPLVSNVTSSDTPFNFGTGVGTQDLQLAKSAINESDTVVRVQDGNIVALGGLMQVDVVVNQSGVPGLQNIPGIGEAFRSTSRTRTKRELVILMKPTVIKGDKDWEQDIQQVRDRIQTYGTSAGSSPSR